MIAVRALTLLGIASVLAGTSSAQSVEAEEARYSDTEVTLQICRDEPDREKKKECLIQLRAQQDAAIAQIEAETAKQRARGDEAKTRLAEQQAENEKLRARNEGLKKLLEITKQELGQEAPE